MTPMDRASFYYKTLSCDIITTTCYEFSTCSPFPGLTAVQNCSEHGPTFICHCWNIVTMFTSLIWLQWAFRKCWCQWVQSFLQSHTAALLMSNIILPDCYSIAICNKENMSEYWKKGSIYCIYLWWCEPT